MNLNFAHADLEADFAFAKQEELARIIDSTLLRTGTQETEILDLCDEALKHSFRSVCVPPCFVAAAKGRLVGSSVRVCTVVGFPTGSHTTHTKVTEALDVVSLGAHEIDYVQNISWVKARDWAHVEKEAHEIMQAAQGRLVKVILETSLLNSEEIYESARRHAFAGIAVIKTSTGFGGRGASLEDLAIIQSAIEQVTRHTGVCYGIKASGGVREKEFALALVRAGATRLGTSAGARLCALETDSSSSSPVSSY